MAKNIYEIFDEFELAKSKKEKMDVIERNLSATLVKVLELTFHPNYTWMENDIPENYKVPNVPVGFSYIQLSTELRKFYMFLKGDPTAERLTPKRRNEVLIQILESLDPRESEVVAGIFRKDQCVKGLTYDFVKEAFPQMLP
jgi:hypothetical protein